MNTIVYPSRHLNNRHLKLLLLVVLCLRGSLITAQAQPCPVGGDTWTARTAAQANAWRSITYGNGIFVAVASDGTNRIMTSPDGITWTPRTAAEPNEWNAVTFGDGLFVAVASSGNRRVMTSPDGITWRAREAAEANSWRSVAYGNGVFVAVASDGTNRVMIGYGGTSWISTLEVEANSWRSITFGNGVFVAVASDGTNRVITSTDGFSWTAVAAAEANAWQSVTYGNGIFAAVASDGTNRTMTSPDGSTWTPQTTPLSTWSSVAYGNGKFVATAPTGTTHRIMNSTDAINWTTRTPAEDNQWESVTYGNNYFVAVSSNGNNRVMTSIDETLAAVRITSNAGFRINPGTSVTFTTTPTNGGTTPTYIWKKNNVIIPNATGPTYTTSTLADRDEIKAEMTGSDACATPTTATSNIITIEIAEACPSDGVLWRERTAAEANPWRSVAYGTVAGNGLFVAVADNGTNRVMTSPDGITWTAQTAAENNSWKSVTFGKGLFVAVSSYGHAMTSPDGINWTTRTIPETNDWSSVIYGNGLFVAVARDGTNRVVTSPDGINWTARVAATANYWSAVTYGNGLFVAVASGGSGSNSTMTSPDGINWTTRSGPSNTWRSVTYGNGLFLAVGEGNIRRVMSSSDGINWTDYIGGAIGLWSAVSYGNGLFVAVTKTNTESQVMTSPDGIDWTLQVEPNPRIFGLSAITYGNGHFVAVSDRGNVMTSTSIAAKVAIVSNEPDNSFIPGTSVTFAATPKNGGNTPVYQWKKNNVNVGANSTTYTDNALANGDVITVEMLSNDPCVAEKTVLSNPIAVEVIVPNCSPSGVTWTSKILAENSEWRSVAYGNGLFVAVSGNGRNQVVTSPDGINWTLQLNSDDLAWRSVTFGNGMFVAVANNGTSSNGERLALMTSPDGIKWTNRTNPTNGFLESVTFGNGIFVAVGLPNGGASIITSTDGITWTGRSNGVIGNTSYRSNVVTYGGGIFVAVTDNNPVPVITSPDGINWTPRAFEATSNWRSVTYGNGRYVAVARSGTNRVMSSPDGINWTLQTENNTSAWESIAFGDNKFIAVASSGDTRVMTSPDGITWTPQVAAENNEWRGITFVNGLFVAVAESGNSRVMTSRAPVTFVPAVSIAAAPGNNITEGTSVTFTATPTNGGSSPSYQWKKNGSNVGTNSDTYTDNTLANGDKITCVMTGNDACATTPTATSNEITMTVCTTLTSYNLTGGGTYCQGGTGLVVGLSNSATGVSYQLKRDNLNAGSAVPGTGNALSFGNQTAPGNYTVVATSVTGGCSAYMNGNVTIGVILKPTVSLTVQQTTLNEGNSQTLCDIDPNPVNSLQWVISTNCLAGSLVWRVQAGNGAWSAWSSTTPTSQPSDNQTYRYQAVCDTNCPNTYTTPIALTLNYRAATPQNVSLIADATTVAAGEEKTICDQSGNTLNFNATCATDERLLYSVDGSLYLPTVPTQIVDGQFHNYRLRCQKADGTASCFETPSEVMRLRITAISAAPVASLNVTSGCGTPVGFSGSTTCGSFTTVWYNAATDVALPNLPTTTPTETTSFYARCQNTAGAGNPGCLSEKSNTVTFTFLSLNTAPVVSVSSDLVCIGTEVTVAANCPEGTSVWWNTGVTASSFKVAFSNLTRQSYWARCVGANGCQSPLSAPKTVSWKGFELTFINVGQSQSATKSNDRAAWASLFITPDAGPELDYSTEGNPTIYFSENVNKTAPRFWTIHAETCNLGTDGSLTFNLLATPELGVIRSYNTHENNAPYFMYANRAGFTELYAQNHPAYGFFADNGNGGNVYDEGLPKGLYKLGVRYWDQKGQGSIYPSTRQPAGRVLAYQEYWFRIQSKNGVGTGSARVAATTDIEQLRTENGVFAQVMPNPVSNILHLKVGQAKDQKVNVSLLDASGRTLIQRSFVPESNQHQEEFEVSQLSNGIYFLKVNTADKQATLKALKVE